MLVTCGIHFIYLYNYIDNIFINYTVSDIKCLILLLLINIMMQHSYKHLATSLLFRRKGRIVFPSLLGLNCELLQFYNRIGILLWNSVPSVLNFLEELSLLSLLFSTFLSRQSSTKFLRGIYSVMINENYCIKIKTI